MTGGICALVLAAGEGMRLRPLTRTVPKALCPVGNVALLDRALARLARHGFAGPATVAVNVCYLADLVSEHVGGRAFISPEPGPPALGTAGAVAHLRDWTAGRALLVGNADAYLSPREPDTADLAVLFDGWDGSTVRVLCVPAATQRAVEFQPGMRFAGFTLMPADVVAGLPAGRSELVHEVWRPAERAGRLELVGYDGVYLDTGTLPDYLAANLHAAGAGSLIAVDAVVTGAVSHSVVGAGARVAGSISRSVVLPGAQVDAQEDLVDAVRQGAALTLHR
jgi:NDP-sugar pyrophosphorylase family protein